MIVFDRNFIWGFAELIASGRNVKLGGHTLVTVLAFCL